MSLFQLSAGFGKGISIPTRFYSSYELNQNCSYGKSFLGQIWPEAKTCYKVYRAYNSFPDRSIPPESATLMGVGAIALHGILSFLAGRPDGSHEPFFGRTYTDKHNTRVVVVLTECVPWVLAITQIGLSILDYRRGLHIKAIATWTMTAVTAYDLKYGLNPKVKTLLDVCSFLSLITLLWKGNLLNRIDACKKLYFMCYN